MALNTVSVRGSLNGYLELFANRREVSTDTLNQHNEIIRKVTTVVEDFATKERDTRADRMMSDEGKATAIATQATATASKLAFLERVVSHAEEEGRTVRANLFTVKAPAAAGTDPLLQYLYGKEIRDRYHGLGPQKLAVAFLKASEVDLDGDPDDEQARANREAFLWAIQQTPGGAEITKDVMRRALESRAMRLNPEAYARLRQVSLFHDSLNGLRDSLVGWLRGLGGNPQVIFDQMGGPLPPEPSIDVARRQVQHA